MHTIIKCWLDSKKTIREVMESSNAPDDDVSKLILEFSELSDLLASLGPTKEMISKSIALTEKAKKIDLRKSPSADLNLVLLNYLLAIHMALSNQPEATHVIAQTKVLLTEKSHASIREKFLLLEALFNYHQNAEFRKSKDLLIQLGKDVKIRTRQDYNIIHQIISFNAIEGYGKDSEQILSSLNPMEKEKVKINSHQFVDAIARGDIAEGKRQLKTLHEDSISMFLKEYIILMNFIDNKWESSIWEQLNYPKNYWPWLEHFVLLHQGRPRESLAIIKQLSQQKIIPYVEILKNLLFTELANGHVESSRFHLKKYLEAFSGHYFNAFYQMYFELINHNIPKASEYFHQVSKSCEKHNAEGKLDFFLNLAPNINFSDIRKMLKTPSSKNIKEKKSSAKKSTKEKALNDELANTIIGSSKQTKNILDEIQKYASINIPILILGETGVGKDIVARNLHHQSDRKQHKFLPINCGAINDSLLQSELFGHVAGAFTGADKERIGIFEAAGKGTVFLDEFGEITPQLQIALLRILENKEVRPMGAAEAKPINCQILFATNANLQKMVTEKKFRKDLLFRINKLTIHITPLRDRPDDILELIKHYLTINREDQQCPRLSQKLKDHFLNYPWPGNIRELKNEIEIARVLNSEKLEYEVYDFKKLFSLTEKTAQPETINKAEPSSSTQAEDDLKMALELNKLRTSSDKRIDRIKNLFNSLEKVYRIDLAKILGVAPKTVTNDLKKLIKEGYIKKIEPIPAPRSHYFVINKD